MIIKDALGHTAEVHLYDNDTGMDFVEDAHYIDDYAKEACNGSNPDFEEALNAEWNFKEM